MKRFYFSLLSLMLVLVANAQFNLGNILNGLGGNSGGESSVTDAISGIVGNLLSSDKLSLSEITGSWTYSEPAVCFKSENLLQKAGGAAVASTIKDKLSPYYKITGLDNIQLTINSDSTFVMKVRKITLQGSVHIINDSESQSNLEFDFSALGKINLGRINAYVVINKVNNSMDLMFDVTKLITIAEKVSVIAKSSAITSAVNLLKSYDGICAGFTMSKTK